MPTIITSNELWKEDPLITKLNRDLKETNLFVALGFFLGIVMGIIIGSGIHDWLFHPLMVK